jgi:hypothetical protein
MEEIMKKIKIEEKDVLELQKLKESLKAFEGKINFIKDQIHEKELTLYNSLKKGATFEHLKWELIPSIIERRFPAWKMWFCKLAGEKEAAKVLNKTKPIKYYYVKIIKKVKIVD